jgi:hypothetical protein
MLQDLIDQVNDMVEELLNNADKKSASELGLDVRASYQKLFVTPEFIAVLKANDNNLQYYGGFEYVDKECRKEFGDYVFYMAEDDRVAGHLEQGGIGRTATLNLDPLIEGAGEADMLDAFGEEDWEALKDADGRTVQVLDEAAPGYYIIKLPCGAVIDNISEDALEH